MAQRHPDQRELDLVTTSELYLKGWTQHKIGQKLGVTTQTICNDLKEIRKRWRESQLHNMDDLKQQELKKLDTLEAEFWDAWERSKDDAVTTKARKEAGLVSRSVSEIQKVGQVGNPAYLNGALRCIEKRCAILGLDEPEKKEITGKDGGAFKMIFNVVGETAEAEDGE